MANTNANGVTRGEDLFCVAPQNMGNGLFWDEATKTYYVGVDDRTLERDELGRLSLRVSALEGNQLQLRDDGLYQGGQAPNHLRYLFVSNQGNDANDGSRDSPLQTVTQALRLIAREGKSGTYDIFLKAGQTFIENREYTHLGQGTVNVTFRYYDDPKYGEQLYDSKGGIWLCAANDLQRPTIVFDTFIDNVGSPRRASFGAYNLMSVTLCGVNIVAKATNGADVGGASFFYCDTLDFQGCDLKITTDRITLGSAKSILLRQCSLSEMHENGKLFIADYSPALFKQVLHYGPVQGNEFSFSPKPETLSSQLKIKNAMAIADYDLNTKTFLGWNANWNIFANI